MSAQTAAPLTAAGIDRIIEESGAALSRRGRFVAAILSLALLLLVGAALLAADAVPVTGARSASVEDAAGAATVSSGAAESAGPVTARWDASPARLSWSDGAPARAESVFSGELGDAVDGGGERLLGLVNTGPGDGILRVTVEPAAAALDATALAGVALSWNVDGVRGSQPLSALMAEGTPHIAEIAVARGDEVQISMELTTLPGSERDVRAADPDTMVSFALDAEMRGAPTAESAASVPWWIPAAIALGLLLGLLVWGLVAASRRNRLCRACGRDLDRRDRRMRVSETGRGSWMLCSDCFARGGRD